MKEILHFNFGIVCMLPIVQTIPELKEETVLQVYGI